jgi:aspartyl/asparaginyl-tRNA synthetase
MTKLVYGLLFMVYCLFLLSTSGAEAVTIRELIEKPQEYDGETVTVQGEAIGDVMLRGKFAWVNLRDETQGIGIFCPRQEAEEIKHTGGYKFRGDIISVTGRFSRSCPEHGGDIDIHTEKIRVVEQGTETLYAFEPNKIKGSIILVSLAFILAVIHLIIRRFR